MTYLTINFFAMKIKISLIIISILLLSCGSNQADVDKLKKENQELKEKIEELSKKIDTIKVQPEQVVIKEIKPPKSAVQTTDEGDEPKNSGKKYTEENALEFIEDYYNYYNADAVYRYPRVRRIANNKFVVSVEECTNKGDFQKNDFFWSSRVLVLTIKSNGKYHVVDK